MGWATKEAQKAWRDANKARCKEYARRAYLRNPKRLTNLPEVVTQERLARRQEYLASYAASHKEEKLARDRKRSKDPLVKASKAAWHRKNQYWRKRDARRRGAASGERIDYKAILIRSNGRCGICGKPLDLFGTDFDHIVPLSKGGAHTDGNLQATHASCNRSKGNRIAA